MIFCYHKTVQNGQYPSQDLGFYCNVLDVRYFQASTCLHSSSLKMTLFFWRNEVAKQVLINMKISCWLGFFFCKHARAIPRPTWVAWFLYRHDEIGRKISCGLCRAL